MGLVDQLVTNEGRVWCSHAIVILSAKTFSDIVEQIIEAKPALSSVVLRIESDQDLLSIDEVRALQRQLLLRSEDQSRLVLVKAYKLTPVVQTSLLKTLENGASNTTIIIHTKPGTKLLPTLKSRVAVVQDYGSLNTENMVSNFTAMSVVERLNEWEKMRDNTDIGSLITGLIDHYTNSKVINTDSSPLQQLLQIYRAWQSDALVSKYAYEAVSLVVPRG